MKDQITAGSESYEFFHEDPNQPTAFPFTDNEKHSQNRQVERTVKNELY